MFDEIQKKILAYDGGNQLQLQNTDLEPFIILGHIHKNLVFHF